MEKQWRCLSLLGTSRNPNVTLPCSKERFHHWRRRRLHHFLTSPETFKPLVPDCPRSQTLKHRSYAKLGLLACVAFIGLTKAYGAQLFAACQQAIRCKVEEPLALLASLNGKLLEEVVHSTASCRVHASVVHAYGKSCRHALESSDSVSDITVRWQLRVEVFGSGEVNTDECNVLVLEPATGYSQCMQRHSQLVSGTCAPEHQSQHACHA